MNATVNTTNATRPTGGKPQGQSGRNVRIARSAKEYIETNFHHPVHLEELSRHTGASIRMVQRCFREHFDTTITDVLKAVRLDEHL